ncbi:FCGBP protein, partial [Aegotheles bennettii]|nr:FCGBP protein [Aegotheles bennettii]
CPENSHYDACGTACPATCAHRDAPTSCPHPCVETCACDPGHVLNGGRCVAVSSCGCTHDGRYHPPGEEFWGDESCHARCRCDAELGMVTCQEAGCKVGEKCSLVRDGVRGCYPTACGVCQVLGAGTYSTFDRRSLRLAGRCRYLLASGGGGGSDGHGDGDGGSGEAFEVEVEEEAGGKIRRLEVTVHGVTVGMEGGEQWEVKVSGERQLLPLVLAGGAVTVTREGTHRVLQARDGPKLLFDGAAYAALTLPVAFRGRTRGLCGDFDGDATNDVTDPRALGDAWGIPTPGCTHGDVPTACPLPPPERCRMLEGP